MRKKHESSNIDDLQPETDYFQELGLPDKEARILNSAIKVFSEKGFSASTTNEIAKKAGIAEGTIFRYYKTKKDILRAILIQAINLVSGRLVMEGVEKILKDSDDKDLREIFKALLLDRIKLLDSFFPVARVIITEAIYHEDVREAIYQNIITRALEVFTLFHAKMSDRGLLRKDITAEDMLRSILGNLAMFIAQRKIYPGKFDLDNLENDAEKAIDILLYGIAAPAPFTAKGGDA
ncbi:MAG: TetR/AcrR family transcriptional regulator [Clostridiales bacterium]|nr:TetR/AcrR family transcriptional regulator [Clostridiales bacterium]